MPGVVIGMEKQRNGSHGACSYVCVRETERENESLINEQALNLRGFQSAYNSTKEGPGLGVVSYAHPGFCRG